MQIQLLVPNPLNSKPKTESLNPYCKSRNLYALALPKWVGVKIRVPFGVS